MNINAANEKVKGPVFSMIECIRQYRFYQLLSKCLNTGSWDMVNGIQIKVKRKILDIEKNRWKSTCLLYNSLGTYNKSVVSLVLHPWWVYVRHFPATYRKVSCVFAILCGRQPVGLQRNFSSSICKLCTNSCRETSLHVLFECDALNNIRETLISNIVCAMPQNMSNSFLSLNNCDRYTILITGLHCKSYIQEWANVYYNIARFVFDMYKKRADLYDLLATD